MKNKLFLGIIGFILRVNIVNREVSNSGSSRLISKACFLRKSARTVSPQLVLFSIITLFLFLSTKVTFAHTNSIHITDEAFNPNSLTINQGDTVSFENFGKNDHWPASNIHPTHDIYPEFDPTKELKSGESWSFKFEKAGEWRFHDHLHPELTGTITVKAVEGYKEGQTNQKTLSLRDQLLRKYD